MFSLNGCIEVFGIQAEPQPPVLLAAVNRAVNPLCRFASLIFAIMSLFTISSSSLLMSSLRLIGIRLGGWTTAGTLGSSTM